MKRRSFLAMLGLAPAVAVAASSSSALDEPVASSPGPADAPFEFEAGNVYLANANIGFTRLSSRDGSIVITQDEIRFLDCPAVIAG